MKRLAYILAFLAIVPLAGCGSSSKADSKSKKSAAKTKKKPKKDPDASPHGKGYKAPQNVWGPEMLAEYVKDLESSDPSKRALAWKGLANIRGVAKRELPDLKKRYAREKNSTVRTEAKRALRIIEDGWTSSSRR
jgi:hypothetical protein